MSTVFVKTFSDIDTDKKEVLRYARCHKPTDEEEKVLNTCIEESKGKFSYKVCYSEFDVKINGDTLDMEFAKIKSESLAKTLENCDRAIVFSATVGIEIDRLVMKYSKISPVKSLFFQAIGTQQIEALCDKFCDEIRTQGAEYTERFSPGYGDLPLELQKEIFSVLDCPRKIGLTLNDTLLMTPTKSVTAIIGMRKKEEK